MTASHSSGRLVPFIRVHQSAPVPLHPRPSVSPRRSSHPPVTNSPSHEAARLTRDRNAQIISEVIGPTRTLSRGEFQRILHRLYIFSETQLAQTFAKNEEGTEFDAIGLKELLVRTANGRPANDFESSLRPILIVGLSNLRSRQPSSRLSLSSAALKGDSTIKRQTEPQPAVVPPSDIDDYYSSTSYDEIDERPAPRPPEPRPLLRKKLSGEGYLPAFYDRLFGQ
jgi:hypothetical protein